jgi:ribonuclease G
MIARQLRLRDMGGILVVDFIDMDKNEHRQQLFDKMKELMENDRAKHNILPLSRFGLMQITRQRVRPVTVINTAETCPSCQGTGKINASSVRFDETIAAQLAYFVQQRKLSTVILKVHPYVAAYFTKGIISLRWRLICRYRCRFIIKTDSSMPYLDLQWSDKAGNKLTVV